MGDNLRKITITMAPDLVDSIDYVSGRLGISRSAFISQLMGESVALLRPLLEAVPLDPTPADAVRFRGESADVVRAKIAMLKGLTHDLFTDQ
ncbi:hypothetical protein D3C84_611580 [compost metagenome]